MDEERRNSRSQRTSELERNQGNDEEQITRTVNVIAGGFAGGRTIKLSWKKYLQEVLNVSSGKIKKPSLTLPPTLEIVFSCSDLEGVIPGHDDPMMISATMVNTEIKRVFVDQGSSADILFRDAFDKLRLNNADLQMHKEELIGFSGEKVHP